MDASTSPAEPASKPFLERLSKRAFRKPGRKLAKALLFEPRLGHTITSVDRWGWDAASGRHRIKIHTDEAAGTVPLPIEVTDMDDLEADSDIRLVTRVAPGGVIETVHPAYGHKIIGVAVTGYDAELRRHHTRIITAREEDLSS